MTSAISNKILHTILLNTRYMNKKYLRQSISPFLRDLCIFLSN